jgi:hypothetical protein
MNEFKGMSRDTQRVKTPTGMWEFARNILLRKGFNSISNEYGNEKYKELPGIEIGRIPANEKTVIFTTDGIYSYIIVQDTVNVDNTNYEPTNIVIKSKYLGFKKHRPIEGVFMYNFNKELIVAFCDGNQSDSNTPKLINLDNLSVELDVNKELVNEDDLIKLNLFISGEQGTININYKGEYTSDFDVIYVTYAYVTDSNNSTTPFFPIGNLAYPSFEFKNNKKQLVELALTNLDNRYNKLVIGLVVAFENSLVGYKSPVFSYNNNSFTYLLNSLSNFTSESVEFISIPPINYDRIKTMTITNNQLLIGNTTTKNIKLQKYINKIQVGLKYVTDKNDYYTHPTLMPDEVYALYIQPQLKSGELLDAYPLIGPNARFNNEKVLESNISLAARGLNEISATEGWKKFHIENTGEFVLPAPYDETNEAHKEMYFGYWENEETYPNNDEFNSTVDYSNISLGGEDLRNTPVRLFRIPGLDNISKKIPNILGYTEKNIPETFDTVNNKFYGQVPRFGIYLKNFEDAIPLEIRNTLQGFKILIVKREEGNRIVEDNGFCMKMFSYKTVNENMGLFNTPTTSLSNLTGSGGQRYSIRSVNTQFGRSYYFSAQTGIYKQKITANIVKSNYAVNLHTNVNTLPVSNIATEINNFGLSMNIASKLNTFLPYDYTLTNTVQQYAVFKELKYLPGYNKAAQNQANVDNVILFSNNALQIYNSNNTQLVADEDVQYFENRWNPLLSNLSNDFITSATLNVYNPETRTYTPSSSPLPLNIDFVNAYNLLNVTLINLRKNINVGLNPNNFIVLGEVNINYENSNKVLDLYGDVFTNNAIIIPIADHNNFGAPGLAIVFRELYIKGLFSVTSNSLYYQPKDKNFGQTYSFTDILLNPPGSPVMINYNNESQRSLNDLITATSFNVNNILINNFPYRVSRSLKIQNENLQINNIRTFLANDYYEMPNNKGEIIAIRGMNKQVYIIQEFSTFTALIKDRLISGNETTYLAEGELFDRTPDEIRFNDNTGYVGCTSQFSCFISPVGLIIVDQIKGKIFIVAGEIQEISAYYMYNWFENNLNTTEIFRLDTRFINKKVRIDNPFTEVGIVCTYDLLFQRLLITKKDYVPISNNIIYSNGNPFITTSIDVQRLVFVLLNNPTNNSTVTFDLLLNNNVINSITFTFISEGSIENGVLIGETIEETMFILTQAIVFNFNNFINSFDLTGSILSLVGVIEDYIGFYNFYIQSDTIDYTIEEDVQQTTNLIIPVDYYNELYFKEISKTLSYSVENKAWVCEHDYLPNSYYYNYKQLISSKIINGNTVLYLQNSKTVNRGIFFDTIYDSYVDLIFNGRLDLSKLYQNISWESVVKTIQGATLYNKTIDKIAIYNEYQCSGEIDITLFNTTRNVEGIWNFNDFRDIVVDDTSPIVDGVGVLIQQNQNINKSFFDNSNFISTFIVIRLIMKNSTTNDIYINNVQVKSRTSQR